ncbi:MAG: Gfo/Idh/MocA family oxidoreductase [Clostridia bacterium]|nr:Gfo/Idh/MocA family oxidoreductase [Clostridia bacterium]
MVKVGILGAGFMGRTHADAYKQLKDVEIYGVSNRSREKGEKFSQDYKCRYFQGAEQLIEDENVDVIDICLPTYLHEKYAVMAARQGKHILLEKPFALSIQAAQNIVDAVHQAGVKFMVAQVVRFWPEYVKIKQIYDDGLLGDIKVVYANRLAQHPNWSDWFRDVEKGGGGLFDLHLHDIDYVRYLLGPVESVYATGKKSDNQAWNHVVSILNFKNGSKACVEGAYEMTDNYPFTMAFRAVGQTGTVDFDFSAGFNLEDRESAINRMVLYQNQKDPEIVSIEQRDAYLNEIEYFIDCIKNDKPIEVVTPDESLEVLRIILALQESLETGRVVKI